jgi:hypothetical protein
MGREIPHGRYEEVTAIHTDDGCAYRDLRVGLRANNIETMS